VLGLPEGRYTTALLLMQSAPASTRHTPSNPACFRDGNTRQRVTPSVVEEPYVIRPKGRRQDNYGRSTSSFMCPAGAVLEFRVLRQAACRTSEDAAGLASIHW
jgi:hypothetical protein